MTTRSKSIQDLLAEVEDRLCCDDTNRMESSLKAALSAVLQAIYTRVRGAVAPSIVTRLVALEIAIGGEDADFKTFDCEKIIELFVRGEVFGLFEEEFGKSLGLASAVNFDLLKKWFREGEKGGQRTRSSFAFAYAWLRLVAESTGTINSEPVVKDSGRCTDEKKRTAFLREDGKPFTETTTGICFVHVPGGTFFMGDGFEEGIADEQPVHEIQLSPFYMATCPVTQAQWLRLMEENPSNFIGGDHPVEQVTFSDAMRFIERLNAASPPGISFGLPSEAQWEYAARSAGKKQRYAGGDDVDAVAWYRENSAGGTSPVAAKTPNGLGLFDMSGNVWEWCRDYYREQAYQYHEKIDPVCTRDGQDRVIRGGSWHLDAWSVRCTRRFRFDPELFGPALGFRLIMKVNG